VRHAECDRETQKKQLKEKASEKKAAITRCRRPGRGATLWLGVGGEAGGEAGGGEAERNRHPPGRGPWAVRWPEDASDNEPDFVLARGLHAVGDL
jgi:hypothetical protein